MHDVEYCMITSPIQHIHHAPTKVTWRSYDRWKSAKPITKICWQSFVEAAGSYKCSRKATAPCVRNITRPLFPSSEQATRMKQNWIDILYDQSDDWNRLKFFSEEGWIDVTDHTILLFVAFLLPWAEFCDFSNAHKTSKFLWTPHAQKKEQAKRKWRKVVVSNFSSTRSS